MAQPQDNIVIRVENVSENLSVRRDSYKVGALEDISLDIREGEFVTVVGPSGCGKSTLIKLIAGLVGSSTGRIVCQGEEVRGLNTKVATCPRKVSFSPGSRWRENVAFGLDSKPYSKQERADRVRHFIQLAGLAGFEKRYPASSRAAWPSAPPSSAPSPTTHGHSNGRTFGPLDAQTRMILQDELLKIWEQKRQTIIFVTHDLVEAVALADRIVVMTHRPGKIRDVIAVPMSRPRNIFEIPPPRRLRRSPCPVVEYFSP